MAAVIVGSLALALLSLILVAVRSAIDVPWF